MSARDEALEIWFDPRRFYRDGYPEGYWSSISHSPPIVNEARKAIVELGVRTGLEVGPGECPILKGLVEGPIYVDMAAHFLRNLGSGFRVQADVRSLPFRERFDIVVAMDVLPHVPPAERSAALSQVLGLARAALFYGCEFVEGPRRSPVKSVPEAHLAQEWLRDEIFRHGFDLRYRTWHEILDAGPYERTLTVAWRTEA